MLKCPFHNDGKASMKIYPETNTAYCFAGSCQIKSLDSIDFIMQMDKSTKHEALKKAKSLINPNTANQNLTTMPQLTTDQNTQLLTEIFSYFQKGIKHPAAKTAKQYKASRGLNGKVPIGYNAGSFHQNKSEEVVERLLKAALIKPSEIGYQTWANKCLVFPLKNQKGEIVSFYGRSTIAEGHYYLQNRRGLYPGYPDLKIKKLVLTESVIDAASLLQLESLLENYAILSLYGTNGLTTEHRQAILQCLKLEEIIFALDGDEAGRKATETYTNQLKQLYPDVRFTTLNIPEGEDVNSLHVNHTDQSESLFLSLFEDRIEVGSLPNKSKSTEEIIATKSNLITDNAELLIYENDLLQIIVLGGIRLESLDRLRVTLKVNYEGKTLRHNLDLYNDDQVEKFIKKVCNRLDLGSREVQEILDELTEELETYRLEQMESTTPNKSTVKQLTEKEKEKAKKYLSAKTLMKRTMTDLGKSGIIGEELNRLLMYIVMTSRKRDHPLHVMSLAASGQGKTHLQERVSDCMPEEDKMEITSLSDNALYYFGREELRHKLLLIEDLDGAEGVLYPLRELQSKRRITKTVTLKDAKGKLKTKSLEVEGPVSVAGCTTKEYLYEDNANRSFLLYLDNSEEQDKRIMNYQRSLSAGKIDRQSEEEVRVMLQNAQRLLRNVQVRNPYAEKLQIPNSVFKPRRSNAHYLAFIEAITFYHQYQRELKTNPTTSERYIETSLEDIEWANKLLAPVLLRKSDELSGACRTFLEELKIYLKEKKKRSFYSKEIRLDLRKNYSSLKRYLINLSQNGYVKIVGGTKSRGFEYEVVNLEEYKELKSKVKTVLDDILKGISGSVDQSGSK
jgi:DNA primase